MLCVLIDSHVEGEVIRRAVSASIGDVMNSADGHDDLANGIHYRQIYDCSESTQTQSAITAHTHRSDRLSELHSISKCGTDSDSSVREFPHKTYLNFPSQESAMMAPMMGVK